MFEFIIIHDDVLEMVHQELSTLLHKRRVEHMRQ
jgi:hypothetical protein